MPGAAGETGAFSLAAEVEGQGHRQEESRRLSGVGRQGGGAARRLMVMGVEHGAVHAADYDTKDM